MKNVLMKIFIFILVFVMVFPSTLFASSVSDAIGGLEGMIEASSEDIEKMRTNNAFEQVLTEFFLSVGDFAQDFLSQSFREEITIDKLVFNKAVMLNANFFTRSANPSASNAAKIVGDFINNWFSFFQKITLVIIMIFILVAGIRIILGTPNSKVKAKELIFKLVMAVVLVYFFPFVMRYTFDINDAIVSGIYNKTHVVDTALGASISPVSDFLIDEIEFRSPQYVSLDSMKIGAGSTEATQLYLNKLEQYAARADLMRMMRAFAGVTLRFMYVIIWYILLVQTYMMVIIYIKRFMVIAFLIAVYPLVIIGYVTGSTFGASHTAFNKWCSKFFTNVLLQSMHAIIFGLITGIMVEQIRTSIESQLDGSGQISNINWILMIVATSFLFSAEKIVTKLWHAALDTSERDGVKNFIGAPRQFLNRIKG